MLELVPTDRRNSHAHVRTRPHTFTVFQGVAFSRKSPLSASSCTALQVSLLVHASRQFLFKPLLFGLRRSHSTDEFPDLFRKAAAAVRKQALHGGVPAFDDRTTCLPQRLCARVADCGFSVGAFRMPRAAARATRRLTSPGWCTRDLRIRAFSRRAVGATRPSGRGAKAVIVVSG